MITDIFVDKFYPKAYPKAYYYYELHVPEEAKNKENLGLVVDHDGFNHEEAEAMLALAREGKAPYCVHLAIEGGRVLPTIDGGTKRYIRAVSFDTFSDKFPDFLVDEFLPEIIKKHNLSISSSPDMHLISGGSSGGFSAMNVAFRRHDYFHRVYMGSPSFVAFAKGNELTTLIRKSEPKPLRIYTEYSENDFDGYQGNFYLAGKEAACALAFSGYDVKECFIPGEGHISRVRDYDSAYKRLEFLWADWDTRPVTVKALSPQVDTVIPIDSKWEKTDHFFEKVKTQSTGRYTASGEYSFVDDKIFFTTEGKTKEVASGFGKISSLAISSDKWRLYVGDTARGCVYSAVMEKDGTISAVYTHAFLHLNADFITPGAFDICVDNEDRIYAATELGIQVARNFGPIDVILENPDKTNPKRVSISDTGYLYVETQAGIYRRKIKNQKVSDQQTTPNRLSYFEFE